MEVLLISNVNGWHRELDPRMLLRPLVVWMTDRPNLIGPSISTVAAIGVPNPPHLPPARYRYLVVTRSDLLCVRPHPPLRALRRREVLVPRGQDYHGVNDRHMALRTTDAAQVSPSPIDLNLRPHSANAMWQIP